MSLRIVFSLAEGNQAGVHARNIHEHLPRAREVGRGRYRLDLFDVATDRLPDGMEKFTTDYEVEVREKGVSCNAQPGRYRLDGVAMAAEVTMAPGNQRNIIISKGISVTAVQTFYRDLIAGKLRPYQPFASAKS